MDQTRYHLDQQLSKNKRQEITITQLRTALSLAQNDLANVNRPNEFIQLAKTERDAAQVLLKAAQIQQQNDKLTMGRLEGMIEENTIMQNELRAALNEANTEKSRLIDLINEKDVDMVKLRQQITDEIKQQTDEVIWLKNELAQARTQHNDLLNQLEAAKNRNLETQQRLEDANAALVLSQANENKEKLNLAIVNETLATVNQELATNRQLYSIAQQKILENERLLKEKKDEYRSSIVDLKKNWITWMRSTTMSFYKNQMMQRH